MLELLAFFGLFMAWCNLRSVSEDDVNLDGGYNGQNESQPKKRPRKLHHLGLHLQVLMCQPLLVRRKSGYKRGRLSDGLCNATGVVLVLIQRLLVNIKKLLLWVARKVVGYPLPVFLRSREIYLLAE